LPNTIVGTLVATTSGAVIGGDLPYYSLSLWHGITPALFMSIAAVIGGFLLLLAHRGLQRAWNDTPRPEAKVIFDALIDLCARAAQRVTDLAHDGAMSRYLAIFTVAAGGRGRGGLLGRRAWRGNPGVLPMAPLAVVGMILVVVASVATAALHHNRLLSLVLISVNGLMISVGFVYLSAPDLALTQISVEVVTIMLLLLALNFMPKTSPRESSGGRRLRDAVIAGMGGLGVGGLLYAVTTRDLGFDRISDFHLDQSYRAAAAPMSST
jgi:multicomponent K+:H+ antiporter subunit A